MNITEKNDYSILFSSLNKSLTDNSMSSLMTSFNFSDLSSIRNGTYKMALDSYYSTQDSDSTSSSSSSSFDGVNSSTNNATLTEAEQATLSQYQNITTATSNLLTNAESLSTTTNNTLFNTDELDMDKVYEEVSDFVNNYNDMMSEGITSSTFLNSQVDNLATNTAIYSSSLENIGITINSDNTLTIDEEKFKSSDIESIQSVFNGSNSFAAQVGDRASFINYLADKEVNTTSSYNFSGNYENSFSSGNLFDSLF